MAPDTENIEAKLCAYIDGELDEEGRAEIDQHLATHPHHKALVDELIHGRQLLTSLPRVKAPADFAETVHGQIERRALLDEGGDSPDVLLRINRWPQYIAVAAILLLAVGLGVLIYSVLPSADMSGGKNTSVAMAPVARTELENRDASRALPSRTAAVAPAVAPALTPSTRELRHGMEVAKAPGEPVERKRASDTTSPVVAMKPAATATPASPASAPAKSRGVDPWADWLNGQNNPRDNAPGAAVANASKGGEHYPPATPNAGLTWGDPSYAPAIVGAKAKEGAANNANAAVAINENANRAAVEKLLAGQVVDKLAMVPKDGTDAYNYSNALNDPNSVVLVVNAANSNAAREAQLEVGRFFVDNRISWQPAESALAEQAGNASNFSNAGTMNAGNFNGTGVVLNATAGFNNVAVPLIVATQPTANGILLPPPTTPEPTGIVAMGNNNNEGVLKKQTDAQKPAAPASPAIVDLAGGQSPAGKSGERPQLAENSLLTSNSTHGENIFSAMTSNANGGSINGQVLFFNNRSGNGGRAFVALARMNRGQIAGLNRSLGDNVALRGQLRNDVIGPRTEALASLRNIANEADKPAGPAPAASATQVAINGQQWNTTTGDAPVAGGGASSPRAYKGDSAPALADGSDRSRVADKARGGDQVVSKDADMKHADEADINPAAPAAIHAKGGVAAARRPGAARGMGFNRAAEDARAGFEQAEVERQQNMSRGSQRLQQQVADGNNPAQQQEMFSQSPATQRRQVAASTQMPQEEQSRNFGQTTAVAQQVAQARPTLAAVAPAAMPAPAETTLIAGGTVQQQPAAQQQDDSQTLNVLIVVNDLTAAPPVAAAPVTQPAAKAEIIAAPASRAASMPADHSQSK